MSKFANWVHGTDVNIEYPDRVHDGGPNTRRGHPRRAGWGTVIRQPRGDNWFHFAIPTPTQIDADWHDVTPPMVEVEDAYLHATVNEAARVDAVHAWVGNEQIWREDNISGLENEEIYKKWNITDRILLPFKGVGLSVHVSFSSGDELGSVTFHGAGAQFDTIEGLF